VEASTSVAAITQMKASTTEHPFPHPSQANCEEEAGKVDVTLPINTEDKTTILLNVEGAVKDIVSNLAKKQEIKGATIDAERFNHLPNSITGVVIHYVIEGLKRDFGITFAEQPVSLKQRGGNSNYDRKVAGKKRLLTREQKNELLAKTQMSFYEEHIARGDMSIENAMFAIRDAYERKQNFEEMGYMLPTKKTEYPYWIDEAQ
jgi:hypothetical protein